MSHLYDTDFYGWIEEQAELLRAGRLDELDTAHLMEALEEMGGSFRSELTNRMAVLLTHLLKWRYQPHYRGTSWELTLKEQRRAIAALLRRHPSLRPRRYEALEDAYGVATVRAARETRLPETAFPTDCPWTVEQVLDPDFWP